MAAGSTYEPIATTTLGSAAASITFSSIPSTYTDLRLVFTGTGTAVANAWGIFNGDTGTNYSGTILNGSGSAAASARYTTNAYIYFTYYTNFPTTPPSMITMDIFSYAGSTYKTALYTLSQDYNGSGSVSVGVALWRSTAAINSVSIQAPSNTWATGTTATLYGIKAA